MQTIEQNTGNRGVLEKRDFKSVIYVKRGRSGGMWAHPVLALEYAKFLSPALHYEVNEAFLRSRYDLWV